jgi:hypothetical protein
VIRLKHPAPKPQTVTPDELDAWADAHGVGVQEVTPGHFYACTVVAGVVEVRMAYGARKAASA